MTEEEAKALKPGDLIFWRDPDNGICSGSYQISKIHRLDLVTGEIAITTLDQSWFECSISELKRLDITQFSKTESEDWVELHQLQQALWLESDDGENEAVSDHGHIILVRDFRASGDPAVILSKTMLAAPELLEMLDNVTASLETCVAHFQNDMPDADRVRRAELARRARTLVDRLMGREEEEDE